MSKDLFLIMREQEVNTNNFLPTKKELKKSTNDFAKKLIDSGDYDINELYTQALRLKETFVELEKELKGQINDFEAFGVKAVSRSGGYTLDYSKDDLHSDLTSKVKEREELLKLSEKSKDSIYDSYGVEVPKLPRKYRKDSINVSF